MRKNQKKLPDLFNLANFKNSILTIMKTGISISFVLLLFSTLLLSLYIEFHSPNYLYELGCSIFKSSTTFIAFIIIYGFSFNKIACDLNL